MWQAMSPPQSIAENSIPPATSQSFAPDGTHTTTVPNPDGSSTIYVHHMNCNAPSAPPPPQQPLQQQMPQMMGMMGMPPPPMYSYPYPPTPSSYGCPYYTQQQQHHQQQQQPTVVILEQEEEKKEEKKDKPKEKKPDKPKEKKPPPKKYPQKFSKFSITSVVLFALGLMFGVACVVKTYETEELRFEGVDYESEEFIVTRTVAMGTGGAGTLCMTIATLCSFYAGMRHKSKGEGKGHVCIGGLVIAAWIIFCLTFCTNLIILIIAFDHEQPIYPEVVWAALIGSILSWMFMFGYSEISRRAYVV